MKMTERRLRFITEDLESIRELCRENGFSLYTTDSRGNILNNYLYNIETAANPMDSESDRWLLKEESEAILKLKKRFEKFTEGYIKYVYDQEFENIYIEADEADLLTILHKSRGDKNINLAERTDGKGFFIIVSNYKNI